MYVIVETEPGHAGDWREVGQFECPYTALNALRGAVKQSEGRAQLQLIAPGGQILVDTSDVLAGH